MRAVTKIAAGPGNVELREVPEPKPGPGEVKVALGAAGIRPANTDLWRGGDPRMSYRFPLIMGSELGGTVVEIGEGVQADWLGARVAVETTFGTCGRCRYCRTGNYNLCHQRTIIGYTADGCFADFTISPEYCLHRLPAGLSFPEAVLAQRLAVAIHGIMDMVTICSTDWVAITGPGTIGLLATQIALAEGAKVVVIGIGKDAERLKLARELGAAKAINVEAEDAEAIIRDITGGDGADVFLECSGVTSSSRLGLRLVRKQGQFSQIGISGKTVELDFELIARKELRVRGSFSQNWLAWERALQLLGEGKVKAKPLITGSFPLTEWEAAFRCIDEKGLKVILTP